MSGDPIDPGLHAAAPGTAPRREPGDVAAAGERSTARTAALVALPAVMGAGAIGGALFLLPDDGDDSLRSGDSAPTSAPSTTVAATAAPSTQVFTAAATTVAPTTATPTTRVTTTAAPTTTIAPTTTDPGPTIPTETLVDEPAEPIAPPPDPRGFEEQIQLGGISIPKIGLDAPLLEGIRLTTLDNGPGHWPGTALPGEDGNVVIAAHRTSHGAAFRHIDQLEPGDTVSFTTADGVTDYLVTETMIVNPDALWIVDQTDDATATLFACHPPGSVAQRIVVKLALAA